MPLGLGYFVDNGCPYDSNADFVCAVSVGRLLLVCWGDRVYDGVCVAVAAGADADPFLSGKG